VEQPKCACPLPGLLLALLRCTCPVCAFRAPALPCFTSPLLPNPPALPLCRALPCNAVLADALAAHISAPPPRPRCLCPTGLLTHCAAGYCRCPTAPLPNLLQPCRDIEHAAFPAEYARDLLDAMHNDPSHNATWDLFWSAHPGPDGTFTPEVGAGQPPQTAWGQAAATAAGHAARLQAQRMPHCMTAHIALDGWVPAAPTFPTLHDLVCTHAMLPCRR